MPLEKECQMIGIRNNERVKQSHPERSESKGRTQSKDLFGLPLGSFLATASQDDSQNLLTTNYPQPTTNYSKLPSTPQSPPQKKFLQTPLPQTELPEPWQYFFLAKLFCKILQSYYFLCQIFAKI